jgi:phosphoglycolate phosphatase-like HAD superfamily hydrolase
LSRGSELIFDKCRRLNRSLNTSLTRLNALKNKENAFGPAYQPIYHAMIPWYENWGSKTMAPVDKFMMEPDEFEALRRLRNARYAELLRAGVAPLDGIPEVLAALHGRAPLAVVTSSNHDHFEIIHAGTGNGSVSLGNFVLGTGTLDVNTLDLAFRMDNCSYLNAAIGNLNFSNTTVTVNTLLRLGRMGGGTVPPVATVTLNGGSLTVRSDPGEGSTVAGRVPLAQTPV